MVDFMPTPISDVSNLFICQWTTPSCRLLAIDMRAVSMVEQTAGGTTEITFADRRVEVSEDYPTVFKAWIKCFNAEVMAEFVTVVDDDSEFPEGIA